VTGAERPAVDPSAAREVAILLPDMIGTTICAMPAVETIRAAFPRARLRLLGFRRVAELLCDEPVAAGPAGALHLLELERLDLQLAELFAAGGAPELVFDFLSIPASVAALAAAGIPVRVGWQHRGFEEPAPTVRVPLPGGKGQQSVQDYLDFVEALGLPNPAGATAPRLTAASATLAAARRWLADRGVVGDDRLFVLGIGGGNDRKRWPLERYLELGAWLEQRGAGAPVFFMGPREAAAGLPARLRAALPAAVLAESLPLDLAKGIIACCRLAVCNDHAIMHLAAALGVPTVGVFLASDPAEWFPYPAPASFVIGPPLPCRPCYSEECDGWECNNPSLVLGVRQRLELLLGRS